MKIEIWSDYVCPYCYIGERQLEKALEGFSDKENVEIIYKSFELDPTSSYEVTTNTKDRVARKYGYTSEQAQQMIDNVTKYAKSVGLEYHYDTARYTNSFDAHRIAKYAETKGKGLEMSERLFHAYFTENKEMSDHKALKEIAVEIGLDELEVEDVLKNKKFAEEVRNDEYEASRLGIHAVPFFLINGKYSLSGAQPPEAFENIFEKVLKEEKIETDNLGGMVCGIDGCSPSK